MQLLRITFHKMLHFTLKFMFFFVSTFSIHLSLHPPLLHLLYFTPFPTPPRSKPLPPLNSSSQFTSPPPPFRREADCWKVAFRSKREPGMGYHKYVWTKILEYFLVFFNVVCIQFSAQMFFFSDSSHQKTSAIPYGLNLVSPTSPTFQHW